MELRMDGLKLSRMGIRGRMTLQRKSGKPASDSDQDLDYAVQPTRVGGIDYLGLFGR